MEVIWYSYLTDENKNGSIMCHPKLEKLFDENILFKMNDVEKKRVNLNEIYDKGFNFIGDIDMMETLDIIYNEKNDDKKITGLYMHGSRSELISEKLDIDFKLEPDSDNDLESLDDCEESLDNVFSSIFKK